MTLTGAEIGQIITAVFSGIGVILSGIAAIKASNADKKSEATHLAVNSRMDEFKRLFEEKFVAVGQLKEKTEQATVKAGVAEALHEAGIVPAMPGASPAATVVEVQDMHVEAKSVSVQGAANKEKPK